MAEETVRALLAKALRRQKELQYELQTLQRLIDGYRRLEDMRGGEAASDQLHLWHGASRRALKAQEVADMVEETQRIILAEGRPMKRGELVQRLEARGYRLAGADKNKVLGTNLWRSGKFEHLEGRGYWPKNIAHPSSSDLF